MITLEVFAAYIKKYIYLFMFCAVAPMKLSFPSHSNLMFFGDKMREQVRQPRASIA